MTTKVMVTIAVKKEGKGWSKDRTLTLAGKDEDHVVAGWINWFPTMLKQSMKGGLLPDDDTGEEDQAGTERGEE